MRYWAYLPIIVLGLGFLGALKAQAEPTEVLVPLFVEREYQGDVFIYLNPAQPVSGNIIPAPSLTEPAPSPVSGQIDADKVLGYLEKWVDLLKLIELKASVSTVDGKHLLDFDRFAKAQLKFEFLEDKVEAHISVPPEIRKDQVLILRGLGMKVSEQDLAKQADFSSFLNFSSSEVYQNNVPNSSSGLQPFGTAFSGAFNERSWVLEWNAAYRDQTPASEGGNWSRQDIRLVKDFPEVMIRSSAGDLTYPTSYFQEYQTMGGIGATTTFGLQPYKLVVPSGSNTFYLKSPSTVTIIRNGERLQSFSLPAGTHSIRELPVSIGINQLTLEIRDQFGQVELINIPINVASLSLAEGVHQITYNLGYESTITTDDIIYDSSLPAYSIYHRYGLTNNLTVGASFQGDPNHGDQGAEALFSGSYGSLQADVAHSFLTSVGDGYAARILYNYDDNRPSNKKLRSIEASIEWDGKKFTHLTDTDAEQVQAWIYDLTYTESLTETMTGNIGGEYDVNRSLGLGYMDSWDVDFGLSKTIDDRWFINFNLSYGRSETGNTDVSIRTFVIWSFPEHRQSVSVTSDIEHQDSGNTQDLRTEYRYTSGGLSDRVDVIAGNDILLDSFNTDLHFNYTGNRGQLGLLQQTIGPAGAPGQDITTLTAAAGIAIADGRVTYGQPITDSFAIVTRPKAWHEPFDINPGPDDTYTARVDSWGPGLVPTLNSYQYYPLRFNNAQLEEGHVFSKNSYIMLPTYKSGYLILPGSEATVLLSGVLLSSQSQPIALMAGTLRSTSKPADSPIEFFTNANGQFVAEGLNAGMYDLHVNDADFKDLSITVPKDQVGPYDAGQLMVFEK